MKRFMILLFALLNILILSACNISESNISDKINTPINKNIPILGEWKIKKHIYGDKEGEKDEDLYLGKKGLFHKDAVIIGEDYVIEPTFKFKKVKTDNYLLYKYKVNPGSLNLDKEEIEIISVFNDNQYFYEFIKVDKNHLIVHIDDNFYEMEQITDEVSDEKIAKYLDSDESMFRAFDAKKREEEDQTGLLLGLKISVYDEVNDIPQWEYQTMWINYGADNVINIYELDDLFVPRKNGFWMIDVERSVDEDDVGDSINIEPKFISDDKEGSKDNVSIDDIDNDKLKETLKASSVLKNILFVGNDYISIEDIDMGSGAKRTLKVYTVDNIENEKPIKLSDIIGEEGKDIFEEGAENLLSLDSAIFNESNMGLFRQNGYWIFKGRVNYKKNNEELYKDFDIKAIPPEEMVSYDELKIPWNKLKMQIPQAKDIFSSPNEDIIVVENRSALLIYELSNGKIKDMSPIKKIPLPDKSSVIMSEWATGGYTDTWEEEFIENGGRSIENE
ncbi:MAG TPA: hypothetical protein VK087_06475 [Tissierellaceae bacterium]|nr:hypothetical protein [Tissierellaceae bacterium]